MKIIIELESSGSIWFAHVEMARENGFVEHLETEIATSNEGPGDVVSIIETIAKAIGHAIQSEMELDDDEP